MAITNTAYLRSNITNTEDEKVEITNSSNVLKINQMDFDIDIVKNVSQNWALPLSNITIETTITNNSELEISDFQIMDFMSEGASFVENSLKIGNVSYDYNPLEAFSAPITLGVGAEMHMTYQILVDKFTDATEITNSTQINLTVDEKQFQINSSEAKITIMQNNVYILKSANVTAVKSGDEIVYTITISNDGELKNTDLYFTDPIPSGTTFVEGSVKVDDIEKTGVNPVDGFDLEDLSPNESIKVEFKVLVD